MYSQKLHSLARGLSFALFPVLAAALSASSSVNFYAIGDLPGGDHETQIRAAGIFSGNLLAVGYATLYGENPDTPITWTPATGIQSLPALVVNTSPQTGALLVTAHAISADGQTIAGRVRSESTGHWTVAALWRNQGSKLTIIGHIPGLAELATANAVSADGSVIYGWNRIPATGGYKGFRWTAATGVVPLGLLRPGDDSSMPGQGAVSADGSFTVGITSSDPRSSEPFIFQQGLGMSALPLPAGGSWGGAFAITPDAKYIAGFGNTTANPEGEILVWKRKGNVKALGLPVTESSADSVALGGLTADGKILVVNMANGGYVHNHQGWFNLQHVLEAAGVDLHDWTSLSAAGISADGNVIFGGGDNSWGHEGFVVRFPSGYLASVGKKAGEADDESDDD